MKKATRFSIGALLLSIALGGMAVGQITINGTSSEPEYQTLASYTSGNDGFSSSNNIDELNYFVNGTTIYIGIPGDLDSNNNIVVWLNFSGYDGQDAGNVIGESGETGVFGSGGFDGAVLDFEVDYAFAFNEGSGTSNLFLDAARYGNTGIIFESGFVGQSDQSGNSATIPSSDITNLFDANTITLAYDNGGGTDEGIEFSIDISNLAGVDSTQTVEIFVAIASSGGFMSNEFIPNGSYAGGNLGDDADIGALTGQYYTDAELLQQNIQITGDAGWRLLSIPKDNATVEDVSDDTPVQGITGGSDTSADANFYIYDSDAAFEEPASVSTTLPNGGGFALYFFDNATNGSTVLPVTLDVSGDAESSSIEFGLNSAASGYTLIGNPFASNFNTNSLDLSGSGTISNNIAFWDAGAGSYSSQDRTTPYIVSPWQGFWVQTLTGSSPSVTIPTSGKTSSDTSGTFFSKTLGNRGDINFTLTSETTFDEAIRVAFRENATFGYDLDDFGKLVPLIPTYATMAFTSNDMLKSVESLPFDLDREVTVELQPQLVGVSGEFTFAWNGLETIPAEWELTLHDYEMDASVNMRDVSEYVFTAGAQAKANPNPLSLLTGPAVVAMKAKTEGNRFGITIRPTSVNNELDETPLSFGLAQNYPNPFNPSTTINYTIENAGAVNLSVYNLMGQRVATLVNEAKTAGTHSIRWNAAGAASGMYYYRLEANGQSITRKMTLIK